MGKMVRAGIVGFGYMGRFHLRKSRLCPEMEVVAVYDVDKSKAGEARQEGLISTHSLEELLAMDLDLILVCTPNDSHRDITIAALKAGKNVMCEKPATLSAAEAEEVVAAAESMGLFYTIHQNRRWDHDYLQVKKVLEDLPGHSDTESPVTAVCRPESLHHAVFPALTEKIRQYQNILKSRSFQGEQPSSLVYFRIHQQMVFIRQRLQRIPD